MVLLYRSLGNTFSVPIALVFYEIVLQRASVSNATVNALFVNGGGEAVRRFAHVRHRLRRVVELLVGYAIVRHVWRRREGVTSERA